MWSLATGRCGAHVEAMWDSFENVRAFWRYVGTQEDGSMHPRELGKLGLTFLDLAMAVCCVLEALLESVTPIRLLLEHWPFYDVWQR
jgi:hypothetical protein